MDKSFQNIAAKAVEFSYLQQMRYVILPQGFRNMIPIFCYLKPSFYSKILP